ncbi:MAG: hypothetical protein SCJ94_01780 [Bacillota bacterium]|nr:hypothetical protein [Bacillota bacterium]
MIEEKLHEAVISLLEPDIYKTTAQIVEELRMEHPALWRQLEKEGKMLFGSSCSSVQQPYTRISQILLALPSDMCLRIFRDKEYIWSRL